MLLGHKRISHKTGSMGHEQQQATAAVSEWLASVGMPAALAKPSTADRLLEERGPMQL